MDKRKGLKLANFIMTVVFFLLIVSALLHEILPVGMFETVHPLLGFAFVILVVFHLVLNWSWVKNNILKTTR